MNAVVETWIDLWRFLRVRKRYWLAPVIVVLLVVAGLVVWLGSSALAPYVYTLF